MGRYDLIDTKKTGEKIGHLLDLRALSLTEAAEKFGVSAATVSYWRSGKKVPSLSHMVALSKYFGCPIDSLVVEKEDENAEKQERYKVEVGVAGDDYEYASNLSYEEALEIKESLSLNQNAYARIVRDYRKYEN